MHQDAEWPAHAAATFRHRVEDGPVLLRDLVAPRDGRDSGRGKRSADLRRPRNGPGIGGEPPRRRTAGDLPGVPDGRGSALGARPPPHPPPPSPLSSVPELSEHLALAAIALAQTPHVVHEPSP